MALVAIPWFVLKTTGSASRTGLAVFFTFLPTVIAGLFGGALVDRLGFRRTSVVADLSSGATVAVIPLLHHTIGIEFWQLLVLVFLGALLDSPGNTARSALVPNVSRDAGMSLERGTSLYNAVERVATLVGPPVAGGLIALFGPAEVLWVDAATFLFSAVVIRMTLPSDPAREPSETSYMSDLREGFAFVRGQHTIMAILFLVTIMNALDSALAFVGIPVFAERILESPTALGLILGSAGAGAVVGSLAFAAWGERLPRRWTMASCLIVVSSFFAGIAAFPPLPVLLVHGFIAGVAAGPLNGILGAAGYERIPEEMRGRALGIIRGLAWMAIPFGGLVGGWMISGVGLRATFLILGGAYVGAALTSLVNPGLRDL